MDYGLFEEALVEFFCRQHLDVTVARSRAAAIIRIAQGCDEEIVGGDRGMEIVCPTTSPFAEYIEAATAITTLDAFLAERGQKKEPPKRAPYEIRLPFGGGWLLEVRQEREAQRREAYRLKRRKAARPPKRRAVRPGAGRTRCCHRVPGLEPAHRRGSGRHRVRRQRSRARPRSTTGDAVAP
jgi:hypothetical protein